MATAIDILQWALVVALGLAGIGLLVRLRWMEGQLKAKTELLRSARQAQWPPITAADVAKISWERQCIRDLEAVLGRAREYTDKLQGELAKSRKFTGEALDERDAAQERIHGLEENLTIARTRAATLGDDATALSVEVQELTDDNEKLQGELSQVDEQRGRAEQQRDSAIRGRDQLSTSSLDVSRQAFELQEKLTKVQEERVSQQMRANDYAGRIWGLQDELGRKQKELSLVVGERDRARRSATEAWHRRYELEQAEKELISIRGDSDIPEAWPLTAWYSVLGGKVHKRMTGGGRSVSHTAGLYKNNAFVGCNLCTARKAEEWLSAVWGSRHDADAGATTSVGGRAGSDDGCRAPLWHRAPRRIVEYGQTPPCGGDPRNKE